MYTYAWGQLVAGVIMNFRYPIWNFTAPIGGIDLPLILVLAWQLVVGTMVSYPLYLVGVTMIGPARASMLSSIEPAATTAMAAVLLATPLVFMDYMGILLITICIIILSIPARAKKADAIKVAENA